MVLLRAIERGLTLSDFEHLTLGMITGFITTYNNEHLKDDEKKDSIRSAIQPDFDNF